MSSQNALNATMGYSEAFLMIRNALVMEIQAQEREFRMECARIVRQGAMAARTFQNVWSAGKVSLLVGLGMHSVRDVQRELSLMKKAWRLARRVPRARYQRDLQELGNAFPWPEDKL